MAATLIYLDLGFGNGSVAGESTAAGYEDVIEIESFSWSLKVEHRREKDQSSAKSLPTLVPEAVKLEKFFDASSTVLVKHMKDRKAFTTAYLTFANAVVNERSTAQKIMQILLEDGFVEDVRLTSSSSGRGMAVKESVSLSFRKFRLTYFPVGATKNERQTRGIPWSFEQPLATA